MPDNLTLSIERALAAAHANLSRASIWSGMADLYGLEDDCAELAREVARLTEDLLRRKPSTRQSRV